MVKRILLGVAVALVVIQFIRPHRNLSAEPPGRDDFIVKFNPPAGVRDTLQQACYDCHSNNTRYPWYAEVQPVGWWLQDHVNEGKRHLNFSIFGTYNLKRQAKGFDHIADEVTNHTMPLSSYTWIHRDARLTEQQVSALSSWSDETRQKIAPNE